MSVDINWDTLTSGPDGVSRAETIRAFIHDKFQQVTLPRFIRSVKVHSFDFGTIPPAVELKDICDPLHDFYEEDEDYPDEDEDEDEDEGNPSQGPSIHDPSRPSKDRRLKDHGRGPSNNESSTISHQRPVPSLNATASGLRTSLAPGDQLGSPLFPRATTPGIPGGTSNMNYFHLPLGAGLSGAATPLAAVAGAQFQSWPDYPIHDRAAPTLNMPLRNVASISSLTPPSTADPASRPQSQHFHDAARRGSKVGSDGSSSQRDFDRTPSPSPPPKMREKSPEDIQVVAHVNYSGDIKMSLTAEILLDYPMPSFVGIPLKLNITGLTFDGVAILAYIRKRAHFCFLSPEDADALIGSESGLDNSQAENQSSNKPIPRRPRIGGLLEHIKVESEIGQKENGKQVLKNVGKVESFVLEQVRRIFEEEFVYPSFWTFLV